MNTNLEKTVKNQRSTYSVIFYLKKTDTKKDGLCPVMGRITIDTGQKAFSLKIKADPDCWDAKENRAIGKSRQTLAVNKTIEDYIDKIDNYYDAILDDQGYITAELVKNALDGVGIRETKLLKLFAEHNKELKLRVGVDREESTLEFYERSYTRLSDFIKQEYETEDINLRALTVSFIEKYDFYLRIDRNMENNTIAAHMKNLKKIIRRAIRQGTLKHNPFYTYACQSEEKVCRHLEPEEIEKLMQTPVAEEKLCYIRDIFVFSCYTGLAYADVFNLSEKHLVTAKDGKVWICINRQKTKVECNIPLMKMPLLIMEKYNNLRNNGKLFKKLSPSCLCRNFRKIETLCGIKHLSFHMARHTFATHFTLAQGVPIATISKLMGHTSTETTEIYAKILDQTVNQDMKVLSERIRGKYALLEENELKVNG
ncbi:MAG: site-specific integrase [Candidatus Symbiothrix sp.]|jgi:site-specific recombinase XerD|nr:site-specific integrase [Candidatus Symbiothrix sp.]